mmetsp:Transcript_26438/g.58429  ORF Transcript_26438/g.58429 Transcript_26438/m.58429 type:complete len:138 (-) Transcript_26438:145-558(-)
MTTGVTVSDDCIQKFNDMKLKHDCKYVIYKISDDNKEIVIDEVGEKGKTYNDFKEKLLATQARYGVIDFNYQTDDGRPQDKLLFVFWSSDDAGVKSKMLYAGSKDAVKKNLQGIAKELQANDASDLDEAEVTKFCKK